MVSSSLVGKQRLTIEKQCAKCPWKKSTDPHAIPHGYSVTSHKKLKRTIAEPGLCSFGGERRVMACHESEVGAESYCIGWLHHQLGEGNNIPLRFKMLDYDLSRVETVGEQHETFEDTLPDSDEDY